MRVLVACEYSGRVRDAFRARGHYAVSCDLLPSETMCMAAGLMAGLAVICRGSSIFLLPAFGATCYGACAIWLAVDQRRQDRWH